MTHDEKREDIALRLAEEMDASPVDDVTTITRRELAILAALPPATSEIGADMVLVPRVPTEAMIKAAWKETLGGSIRTAERAYLAALAASPSALSAGEKDHG